MPPSAVSLHISPSKNLPTKKDYAFASTITTQGTHRQPMTTGLGMDNRGIVLGDTTKPLHPAVEVTLVQCQQVQGSLRELQAEAKGSVVGLAFAT